MPGSQSEEYEKLRREMASFKRFAIIAIGSSLIPLGGLVYLLFSVMAG